MLFINDFHFAIDQHEFEHRNAVIGHELCRYRTTNQIGKLLGAASDVLLRLHNTVTIISALCLNRDDELAPMFIDADIDFVDFDLADSGDGRTQVVLQREGCDASRR